MTLLIVPEIAMINAEFPTLPAEHPSVIDLVDLDEAARRRGCSPSDLFEQADRGEVPAYVVAGSLRFRVCDIAGLPPAA